MNKKYLFPVVICLLLLLSLNTLMISSLSPPLLTKQLLSWGIGIILFLLGTQLDPKHTAKSRWWLWGISCLLLIIPIALNHIVRGSRRWIEIGPVTIQPSEIVKPFLLLFLSTTSHPYLHLIPVIIILLQPDLGSSLSVFLLSTPLILYQPKIFKFAILLLLGLLIISPLLWTKVLHDYQRHRLITFINPYTDPLGKGYNLIQSKIAIGSGGLFGKGYRRGGQSQLLFLPEKHTDFMFAAIGEELGLVGILIVLFSYYLLIFTLIRKAYQSSGSNTPLFLFTLGVAVQIWSQSFINIAMNLGLLPVTGIPLPFLSVGGSSVMSLLFSLGIIFSS